MAEIAVTIVLEKLVSLLDEEARLLGGVHTQVQDIKTELLYIQAFLKDADAKADKVDISHGLQTWIKDLRDTAYSIEDLIDDYLLRLAKRHDKHGFTGFLYKVSRFIQKLKTRHDIASKIRDTQEELVKLKEKGSNYGLVNSFEPGSSSNTASAPWHDPRVTSLFVEEAEIVGIESTKNELISRLVNGTPKRTVISVTGMGGLGKSTLAKKVYDNARVVAHFHCHAWITVSQSFKMEELLRIMIRKFYESRKESVPEGTDMKDEMDLITLTRQYLEDKRYVVVFDDVWKENFWPFIKGVLPENDKGSRIIITTRNEGVASSFKESSFDYIHKLQHLCHDSSWELFCKKTFPDSCPSELEELSRVIVKRCGGLPLAIVAIGGVLWRKEKTVSEWKKFNDDLGSQLKNNSALESINSILSLSYHDLPYYLKSCFLYLSIFPEDHTIRRATLIRLWIAEGFVKAKNGETHEELAEKYLSELIHRSLIQVSEVDFKEKAKSCRIHDLMRELIVEKAEELRFSNILAPEDSSCGRKFRRISIHKSSKHVLDTSSRKSHIRSIFLFDSGKFFTPQLALQLRFLKVLDLEDAPLESVPEELGNVLHLRYLSLRNTKVKMLPRSIGKLQYLETLDLKRSPVEVLPIEVNRLQKLRHFLAYTYNFPYIRGVHVREGIGGLENLQKLCFVEGNHGRGLIEELGKLRQLRRLGIANLARQNGEALCNSISNMEHLKSLAIYSLNEDEIMDLKYMPHPPQCLTTLALIGRLEQLPNWISQLECLVRLSVRFSGLQHQFLQLIGPLPNLLELHISDAYDGEELDFEALWFQKLKFLGLAGCKGLKTVKVDKGALPMLERLRIERAPRLEEVPPDFSHLTKLRALGFFRMRGEFITSVLHKKGRNHWIMEQIPSVNFYSMVVTD